MSSEVASLLSRSSNNCYKPCVNALKSVGLNFMSYYTGDDVLYYKEKKVGTNIKYSNIKTSLCLTYGNAKQTTDYYVPLSQWSFSEL